MIKPRYPIYIPSKGRANKFFTASMFDADGIDFKVVVEPQEVENYVSIVSEDRVLVLPENNRGLVYSRNWIKRHSIESGEERHWQFDDDIQYMMRCHKGYRIPCSSKVALVAAEDFVDRYENVALASFNSTFFVRQAKGVMQNYRPPFHANFRCYTVFLVLNLIKNEWRNRYNEDTDMTLQVLADGWCTILFNAFTIHTPPTMSYTGGQTDIYVNDGRLRMARQLERVWPGVVTTKRKFKRPQHEVKGLWRKFDTPLRYKPGFDPTKIDASKYDMDLKEVKPVKSAGLQKLKQEIDAAKAR